MKVGTLRCTHCHRRQECEEYPKVGFFLECTSCGGINYIAGEYLEFNGDITYLVFQISSRRKQEILALRTRKTP